MADETYNADLAKRRGQVAAGISDPDDKKKFIARQGEGKTSNADLESETFGVRNQQAVGEYANTPYGLAKSK